MRKILKECSPASRVVFLFLLAFVGMTATSLFVFLLFKQIDSVISIYIGTVAQQLLCFIVPAFLIIELSERDPFSYFLTFNQSKHLFRKLVFGVIILIASYFMVAFLTQWNKAVQLPESLSSIEEWMRAMENSAEQTMNSMLRNESPITLFFNLLVVAGMAALSEEIFFRGTMQQLLQQSWHNHHAAVWATAYVFSAIHMQFFGFFPRLVLGALLGYLFVYTGNLWVPVFFHFLNNALVVIVTYIGRDQEWLTQIDEIRITPLFGILALVSALLTVYLFLIYQKKRSPSILKSNNKR